MAEDINGGQNSYDYAGTFSLMRELQYMLYKIARTSELADPKLLVDIQKEAETALRLIDSYMITSQLEVGQTQLELSPIGLGSILHETAYEVRASVGANVQVQVKAPQPVMSNNVLLKNFLFSVGYFIAKSTDSQLKFCTFKGKNNTVGVGVLAKNFDISTRDLRKALLNGSSHMPMAKHTNQSAIMLIVADVIARALGSTLSVKKSGNSKGFSIWLPKSEQMSLV